ncbi:MAG: sulfate transporter CysZ [Endozoicomonas sp. (ex Botrylloides leachii)]|nr:sulfate transporter CysZ [Endozoicomonas sp. (ex Botrylloides leachii)]
MNQNTSLSGPSCLFQGLRMIFDPALRWFVLWPLLINIMVFCGMVYWASLQFSHWMNALTSWLPHWLSFMTYLIWPLFALGMVSAIFFTFTIVGNFIASPFNALLSEKVQVMEGASLPEMALKDWIIIVPKSLGRELKKLFYYLPRALILLILSFIPVINLISPLLWFAFNGWMLTIQYCDYAADNKSIPFKQMTTLLKKNSPTAWGFGLMVNLMMLVPLVNLLIIPAAVVGGTLLWERRVELSTRG